jgi:predicted metal-dependent TIM-barrel fold hydrolase
MVEVCNHSVVMIYLAEGQVLGHMCQAQVLTQFEACSILRLKLLNQFQLNSINAADASAGHQVQKPAPNVEAFVLNS